VLQDIVKAQVTHLYVMPLYPQYAMSSYETAWVKVTETLAAMGQPLQAQALPPFYNDPAYIRTLATVMKDHYPQVSAMPDGSYLLFSFHGLPQRHLKVTDPSHAYCQQVPHCCQKPHPTHATCYRHQCYATVQHLAQHLGLQPSQYGVSFQSRLGKEPWLQPYTDHTIESLAKKGLRQLAVACPAFTTDCLETLEEIAMGCKEAFLEAGGQRFDFIPCLNDHPAFIQFLADKAQTWLQRVDSGSHVPK
jgi:ferrochelatase